MKATPQIFGAIGIVLLLGSTSLNARGWTDDLYVHTDIGPAFVQGAPTTFRLIDIPPSRFPPIAQHGHLKAETDIRADLSVGYNLSKSFAIEAEVGGIWNPDSEPTWDFYQIPAMLNAIYQIRISDSWKPYVGVGAGGVFSTTHALLFHDSDWSAGYQAEAGIKYVVSSHVDIDLGYKFLGVTGYEFRSRRGLSIADLRVNDLYTHSVQMSLTWKF